MEEVKGWQMRPIEPLYPILFLDALMVKMRHEEQVENRAVYVAIGIDLEGRKDVLGLWTSAHEGAKFWLQVLTELRNRGINGNLSAPKAATLRSSILNGILANRESRIRNRVS
jgi:putative transposase